MRLSWIGFIILVSLSQNVFGSESLQDFINKATQRQNFLENATDSEKQSSFDYSSHLNELEIDYKKSQYSFEMHNVPVWGWDIGPYSLESDLDIPSKKVYKNMLGVDVYLTEEDKTLRYQVIRNNGSLILAGINISDMGWLHFISTSVVVKMEDDIFNLSLVKVMSASDLFDTKVRLTHLETGNEFVSFQHSSKNYLRIHDYVFDLGELSRLSGVLDLLSSKNISLFSPVLNRSISMQMLSLSPAPSEKYRWKFSFEEQMEILAH